MYPETLNPKPWSLEGGFRQGLGLEASGVGLQVAVIGLLCLEAPYRWAVFLP